MSTATALRCPHPDCGAELIGLGRFCHACQRYVDTRGQERPAAAIPDTRSEAEIRVAIRGALETMGYVVVDLEQGFRPDGSTRVRRGTPDLYVMGFARSAWMEVKSATGKQSEHQRAFEADCRRCGIPYLLVRSEADAIAWGRERMAEFAGAMSSMALPPAEVDASREGGG